ncbi:proteasome endopeptidase complex [Citrus sinensis]|nr:proteasome endopeptidase complex [Citrus sinensis]
MHAFDGVILGADTRATEGPIVCDKNYMLSSQLQLHRYHTGRESRVVTASTLLKKHLFKVRDSDRFFSLSGYQGYVQAALVLGGVDCTGPHLHILSFLLLIYPHGSTDTLPFATMGSGSLAAMAMFESKYKEGLIVRCFFMFNSLYSHTLTRELGPINYSGKKLSPTRFS